MSCSAGGEQPELDLPQILEYVRDLAKQCGERVLAGYHKENNSLVFKGGADDSEAPTPDIVTEVDKAVEDFLIQNFEKDYPTFSILAEESAETEDLPENPTWVIDPIDGTTNFVHRIPFTCISIGLAVNRKAVLGVVYNPILDELFEAYTGNGAYLNGKKISVTDVDSIQMACVATNVGYDRSASGIEFMMGNFTKLLQSDVRSIRCFGSAACDICSVACGRLDVFYEWGIHAWDIAAAAIIVEEAGGVAVDPSGAKLDLSARCVLVGNPAIAKVMSGLLNCKKPE